MENCMTIFNLLEILAVLFGLVQGTLVLLKKKCNWIFLILMNISYLILAYHTRLWSDVFENTLSIIIGLLGLFTWYNTFINSKIKLNNKIGHITIKYLLKSLLSTLIFTIILYEINKILDGNPMPKLDAMTTAIGFVATFMMADKKIEAWVYWLIYDILQCILHFDPSVSLIGLGFLDLVWIPMAIISYITWTNDYKKRKLKAYFAGGFAFKYKDYSDEALKKDYRSSILKDYNLLKEKPKDVSKLYLSNKIEYEGPFYFYKEKMTSEDVVAKEITSIKNADIIYFILNNTNQPGTITELINASLQDKIIKIYYINQKIDNGEPERNIKSALWYPIIFSKISNKNTSITEVNSVNEATKLIIEDINNND